MRLKNYKTYPVFDSRLFNFDNSTANLEIGELKKENRVLSFDSAWEGDHCVYQNFFKDGPIYRMYYLAHKTGTSTSEIRVCYMESEDGITWKKPKLGLREFNGNKENNIILDKKTDKNLYDSDFFDNFFVFKDSNPQCKKEEKYKALAYKDSYKLECFFSEDGINFKRGYDLNIDGHFDTLNTCFYDLNSNQYVAFVRGFHNIENPIDLNTGIRDIRVSFSKDFKNWSKSELLNFGDKEDYPLYTNNISKYPFNDELYIGFPSRYVERKEWTKNFDLLCGKEQRLERMKDHPRFGLTVTDCVFIFSNDLRNFNRVEEAFITPGLENGYNWVYGDCYPAYGFVEDRDELIMLMRDKQWSKDPAALYKYRIRKDGFVFYKSPYDKRIVITNEFTFDADDLYINFETSARGEIKVILESNDKKIETCPLFGNSTKRKVIFDNGSIKDFKNKNVKLTFEMKDAKLYSLIFE